MEKESFRILVVDDDLRLRDLLKRYLSEQGFNVKTVSDAFIPVGAEVLEFNPAVDADPSIVNRDPYGEGWLVKVKLTDPKECESLLTDAQYKELIG